MISNYSAKYQQLTAREQVLILLTGLVVIVMLSFLLFIDGKLESLNQQEQHIKKLSTENLTSLNSIALMRDSLAQNPNDGLLKQKAHFTNKLSELDQALVMLASELINPIEMRHALGELLQGQSGVTLLSFEVLPVKPFVIGSTVNEEDKADNQASMSHLYQHGIKLKLKGGYFQLRDYLSQLEQLKWRFFWQDFNYRLDKYPNAELDVEIYSLSTDKEFIGV